MRRHHFTPEVHNYTESSRLSQPSRHTFSTSAFQARATQSDYISSENDDASKDVFLCIKISKDQMGCAAYEMESGKLTLVEDVSTSHNRTNVNRYQLVRHQSETSDESNQMGEGLIEERNEMLAAVLNRFSPDLILINSGSPITMHGLVKRESSAVLQIRPEKEFNKNQGFNLLSQLKLHAVIASQSCNNHSTELYQVIESQYASIPLAICAVTVLLNHLQQSAALHNEGDDDNDDELQQRSLSVTQIEIVSLNHTMCLSKDTMKALGIFDEELHVISSTSGGKEGLSLYSLFNHVQSPMARILLRQWLSSPTLSLNILQSRHDAVQLFISKPSLLDLLRKEIKGAKNISSLCARLIEGKADLVMWQAIYDFTAKCLMIRAHCNHLDQNDKEITIIASILSVYMTDRLQYIRRSIGDTIDWSESHISHRISIQEGVDADLDQWRQTYSKLPSILATIASQIRKEIDFELDEAYDMTVEYFPQVGYLQALCYKDGAAADRASIQKGQDMNWTYQYSSEVKAFFKSKVTKQLDGQIGDLHSFIAGREIEIEQRLYDTTCEHLSLIQNCSTIMAELDCLLSFAVVAQKRGYTRPIIQEGAILEIQDGRHPLQELIVESFVPNDTALEGGKGMSPEETSDESEANYNSVLIVTGANACGKSIYLKQVAMITYMAQIGSFVPAKRAVIGIVDKIYTRMQANESTSTSHSSFVTDMQQVSMALQSCTGQSLIILDEMGKGSSSIDGSCLFAATIKHLLQRGDDCPRVVAATHFHEIFHQDYLPSNLNFTPAHMQILVGQDANHPDENVTFLYKLRFGLELTSHASQCELLCGMPHDIVERASYIAQLSRNHNLQELQMRIRDTLQDEHDDNQLSVAENVARAFLQWDVQADVDAALEIGEVASLDPITKLTAILDM